jgi:hypothetical protein
MQPANEHLDGYLSNLFGTNSAHGGTLILLANTTCIKGCFSLVPMRSRLQSWSSWQTEPWHRMLQFIPRKDGVASRSLSGIRCYLLVHSFQDERVGIFGQNRFLTKRPGPFLLSLLAMNGSSQGHFPHRKNVLSNRRFNKHRSGLGEASERPCRLLWCESVVLVQTTSEQRERAVTRGEDPVVGVRSQYP